jgi:2-oxoglutarate dehydrogenase E1 component
MLARGALRGILRSRAAAPARAAAARRRFATSPSTAEPICGTSAAYLEDLYCDWLEDPDSVHVSWNAYFKNIAAGAPPGAAVAKPGAAGGLTLAGAGAGDVSEMLSVQALVRAGGMRAGG